MSTPPFDILPFDVAHASAAEYAAAHRHKTRMRAEELPGDPPQPLHEMVGRMQSVPDFVRVHAWNAWNPDHTEIIASGNVDYVLTEENQHLVQFDIGVDPGHRRRGIARELLRHVVGAAEAAGRRLLMTRSTERVPAGAAFLRRIGATIGQGVHTHQLILPEIDPAKLAAWRRQSAERAAGFAIGFWEGPTPDDRIDQTIALLDMMNTAPRDNLELEDTHLTAEQLRQMERMDAAAGRDRWVAYAQETTTGKLVGFTEVVLSASNPAILRQGMTGVYPEYRGRGLGLYLKSAMLERILRDLPDARCIRTGNADSNAAMLAINHKLGYRPYLSQTFWQVGLEKVKDYLAAP